MTARLLILFTCFFQFSLAQDSALIKKQTDSIVAGIDKATGATQKFRGIRFQQYEYKMIDDSLVKVILVSQRGPGQVKQTWYQHQGALLFATEHETAYYGRDSIKWGGTYYFQQGSLIHYVTLGHGKSEMESWDPQKEVLAAWLKARSAVLDHLKRRTTRISRETP